MNLSRSETLSGPEHPPANGQPARHLIVLLHGLGADGNDLIGLAEPLGKLLPAAHFVSPDAPERCDMGPTGRQWFSLQERDEESLLTGVTAAAPLLERFVDETLRALDLSPRALAFVGFSQGTMMSLHVAYRLAAPCAGVLGFSGALIGAERLEAEIRTRPPAMLIHGDADEVVPVQATLEAAGALGACDVPVQWHISRGIGHGIAADGLETGGRFLRDMLAAG